METKKPQQPKPKREKIEKPEENYEILQQSLLLALLSWYGEITLRKPNTKAKFVPTSFIVDKISLQSEDIDFATLVEDKTKQIITKEISDGVKPSKAKRHSDINRVSISVNMLFDICLELGFFFTLKKSRKTSSTLRIDRIEEVYFNNALLLNKVQVKESRFRELEAIKQSFGNGDSAILQRNSVLLRDALLG
ncbi:hypothetical protein EIN_095740 [Entamoeba invadens IP1]|uniref:Uncharacterized protein n=1 Tax=Entamoeba invadens IP1 TaxID=370355 RepID=A0A0A1U0A8_ENTIV|nr:hypothetical protein EIN_095740 [Entamoeba invadens IP1]ELP87317.1 hypothetical protein EIN_095740 [Entamoeba invadens IP1]|eukprot:XP_004254088.1 hypothetical protein EIN_095740 [Entamoeba invadens IP1]